MLFVSTPEENHMTSDAWRVVRNERTGDGRYVENTVTVYTGENAREYASQRAFDEMNYAFDERLTFRAEPYEIPHY
jgi:hypothetical protein